MQMSLCPAQQRAFEQLSAAVSETPVLVLTGSVGKGKTTVLRALHRTIGGAFLTNQDLIAAFRTHHPLAVEEAFEERVMSALAANDHVIVDDLNLISDVVGSCNSYPRPGLLNGPLTTLATYAAEAGKRLIFGTDSSPPSPIYQRSLDIPIHDFQPADYEFFCNAFLGSALAGRLDYAKIHRYATQLNAHLFKTVCPRLRGSESLDTAGFIEFLRSFGLSSNVDLEEVQRVDLRDLHGVDEVIQSLEDNIILPLENDELSLELGLKPKRGVLLLGPPGTGKTTIGRALAHRLRGKFFLVDGTFISGTDNFYWRVHHIFEQAKRNAPSVLFIDDSDAIFESGQELGLYRYLLTMLDGLESASAGRVCVMLTAMEVGHLPPALLRSGRVELWLEMRLPEENARAAILTNHLASLPATLGAVDFPRLAAATDGFTGADLKRLAEDGKLLLARDKSRGQALRSPTDYFLEAAVTVSANKRRYADAEVRARQQRPVRGPHFDHVGATPSPE